ncbi:HMGL-like family protein [Mycobacterium xenopi 3993]|nr:HMGL-like family protein [Mycobacterium xenopi 3993]
MGYTPYPEIVTTAFVEEAARTGIDIFRIFDALNNVDSMRPAIDAVRDTGKAVAEVAMSYTGDLSDPTEKLYTLDYYLKLAERIVVAGAHVLAIKDMAGLLRAPAAATLVSALKSRFDLPVHVHTHDTPGGQLATYLAAWHAGANAVDGPRRPGRDHKPACVVRDRGRRGANSLRHRVVAVRSVRSGAVLGGTAKGLRALRIRTTSADRAGVPP